MKIFHDFFLRDYLTDSEVSYGLSVYKFYLLRGFITSKQEEALNNIINKFDLDPIDDEWIPF